MGAVSAPIDRIVTEPTAEERVQAGIEWLDQHAPLDWRERINLETLRLDSSRDCIIGQVFSWAATGDGDDGVDYVNRAFGGPIATTGGAITGSWDTSPTSKPGRRL